jgi:glutamate---cysteine ligase / carboxylate-amine ligase
MSEADQNFTIGIEEEYLLVDAETRDVATRPPASFMAKCREALGDRVTHEFLQSQVEVGTAVCRSLAEARDQLTELRGTIARIAEAHDLRMIAASTHPWASWHTQAPVDLERYRLLDEEHRAIARRMVICGMHVHAGIADRNLRIDLMNQITYFLPHLLALSTSSPFWEGFNTGLKAFRPTIIGDLPRSGLPEHLETWGDWQELLGMLDETLGIDDASKIWWDIRPSGKHPTLEVRVCDVCTRLEDGLTIAAIYQSLLSFLYRLRSNNQTWRHYRRILVNENRWRAQRYGCDGKLADFGRRTLTPMSELIEELIGFLAEHAEALGCLADVERARDICARGTSADNQVRIYEEAVSAGASERDAQARVVDWLIEASVEGI